MLTRLRVSGFKNLVDVDLSLGPFTCIAGANGVGKSNILDAIAFLSALSSHSLVEAALCIRDESLRTGDVRSLFHRVGSTYGDTMSFSVDMVIPKIGVDDLGQTATASSTYLTYELTLGYREDSARGSLGRISILEESLNHIKLEDASRRLGFPFSAEWRKSALSGHRGVAFISTEKKEGSPTYIRVHQDGRAGATRKLAAADLPRTALSATTATETPTATLAKREMQSWSLLHLEPSSLRAPDKFIDPSVLGSDGSHLASTLYRMANSASDLDTTSNPKSVYARVANRLSSLIDDVRELEVERDETRQLLTLYVAGSDRTRHPARSLSDGTLRFLALAVLEEDTRSEGLLCLEEPENGIHPKRIPAIIKLLEDIAVDTSSAIGDDNKLRQVLINTHSPAVVSEVPDESLVIATPQVILDRETAYTVTKLSSLPSTWRADKAHMEVVAKGHVQEYFAAATPAVAHATMRARFSAKPKRVIDRSDWLFDMEPSDESPVYSAR